MTEAEWQAEWGFLSSVLHARNPFVGEPDLEPLAGRLRTLHARIVTLLNLHWVDLPDPQSKLLGMVQGEDGRAHVTIFEPFDPGP